MVMWLILARIYSYNRGKSLAVTVKAFIVVSGITNDGIMLGGIAELAVNRTVH